MGYWIDQTQQRVAFGVSDMGVLAGAGEVISTGDDLARFVRVMAGIDAHPVAGAPDLAITNLGTSPTGFIGYALDISIPATGPTRYSKTGSTAGFTCYIGFHRNPAVAVAVMLNQGNVSPKVAGEALLDQLAGL